MDGDWWSALVFALSASPLSERLKTLTAEQPLVLASIQTLHLLAVAALLACNLLIAAGLLRRDGPDPVDLAAARRWVGPSLHALGLAAATGLFLIVRWPERILLSPAFPLKLVFLAAAVALMLAGARRLEDRARGRPAPHAAAIGLGLALAWTATVFAGRWIPFA